ncbi:helix-turn-helix domain-containing protein [Micromonospora sagamiensis]|uniref:Helix-turn-helix protein n=1 Tax=Micromonospora sagamiensis TaxID=47875 RepID=A0A562WKS3_9ACTN|nr:helix-turn-helix transcriptional regulator [Micromonospora sagamiensis]TWJ30641.1 helix-turn-helix protein [Micromonospora sagamiensis]BCL16327.1 transcriptional regulator [Micromonospora sagamiensis]
MVLLRRVIGDALRARRQGQHRTLREVSSAANVSLGYLSEIERGQKEPSSELLAAICDALGARLSEVLREVSDTVALAEQMPGVLVPVAGESAEPVARPSVRKVAPQGVRQVTADGPVSVAVRQDSPLKATLRTTRVRPAERDVVCAA